MRALVVVAQNSTPEIQDIDVPKPAVGEILIRVSACGLNFADLLMISGKYQDIPGYPLTLGMEFSGIVADVGPDVSSDFVGKRVAAFGGHGGLAEFATVDANRCIILPDDMAFDQAAGFIVAYGTSHLALKHRAKLMAGETLVVLGASGGVGLTAVEIGAAMGANVIAVARGAAKLAVAKGAGAHHLIDSDGGNLKDQVRALGGADVVYDPVGGALFDSVLRACNPEARLLNIGFASGTIPQIPANILLVKNLTAIGFYWGGYLKFAPKILNGSLSDLISMHQAGKISPHISNLMPLEKANDALDLLAQRKATGKVVVTI